MKSFFIFCCLMVLNISFLEAQDTGQADFDNHTWDVFVTRDIDDSGMDSVTFIDVLSGESVSVDVNGERYTLLQKSVIFFDRLEQKMKIITPNGFVQEHPFINFPFGARRLDWIVSSDHKSIVWTLTQGEDSNSLFTRTFLASVDGSNIQQIFSDGPRSSVRVLPVAFSENHHELYMDSQPDGISQYAPYTQYAGLFALNLNSGDIRSLPGEPSCFCGAGFGSGTMLRLALNDDLSGFDVLVYSVAGGEVRRIPAIARRNYTQAGDILIAPDGEQAVYALSQVNGFGTANQIVRTVFIKIDLLTLEQEIINDPITTFVHPIAWSEDDTAILFTSEQQNGTWKINLDDARLVKVAEAAYLGTLQNVE